ncbi:MAG: hypothetical protein ACP5TV_13460, partial [Anaerolineae bacterium]
NEAGLSSNDQQKLIGSLTQEVMLSLPQEKRKGYLFQPKTFMLLDSLVNAILAAEGITPEMLEEQRRRQELINSFLRMKDDEKGFQMLIEQNKERLDYEFFQTLTAMAEAMAQAGDEAGANLLLGLRAKILKAVAPERPAEEVARLEAEQPLTREDLLEALLEIEDEKELEAMIALARPLIDYPFYLLIAERIQALEKEERMDEAQKLSDLRERLLEITERLDEEARQALRRASDLLRQAYHAEHPEQVLQEHINEIDDLFFYVLSVNMEQAVREDARANAPAIAKLRQIAELAADAVEQRMPPALRFVNQLLRAGSDEERRRMLENPPVPPAELTELVEALIRQFQTSGQDSVVRKLEMVRELLEHKAEAPQT